MTLYVLDTDHLSLFERGHPVVVKRVIDERRNRRSKLFTTVISMQEQLEGRLAQVRRAESQKKLVFAYQKLMGTYEMFSSLDVLAYDSDAGDYFQLFRKEGVRIGTQDLRIGSIVLSNQGILLTRNRRDFEKVPGLKIEDWSF